jgi:triosephosphate isomerase
VRRPVIAGNWKMFKTLAETRAFFDAFKPLVATASHCDVVVAPPFPSLVAAVEGARGSSIIVAAQNAHWEREGAFTGEVSMRMVADTGCRTDESVNRKLKAALEAGLTPIVCVGETPSEREENRTHVCLKRQFEGGLAALTTADFSRILLAYEPLWAIGTGRTATPEIAADAHRCLRELAATRFTSERAAALRILYGGSVKPDNIRGLMAQPEIDGALVGGASLDPQSFAGIVNF